VHRAHRDDMAEPLIKPRGETVYELVGASDHIGGAATHSIAEITIRADGSSAKHHHRRSEETYYILHGHGRLVVDSVDYRLRVGDACLIRPGEWHQIFNDSSEDELVLLAVSSPPWIAQDSVFDEPADHIG